MRAAATTRRTGPSRRSVRTRAAGSLLGFALVLLLPAVALAHPLGNFTINHYAGIRVEPGRVLLDVVVDQAEIPTFQARLAFDTDGDGEVSDEEADAGRVSECEALSPSLELAVAGARPSLVLTYAGLTFPPGVGGLSTMRLVCGFRADLASPIAAETAMTFADTSFADRLGWREIVVTGSEVSVTGADAPLRESSVSDRLTAYPTDQLAQAPADREVSFNVVPRRRCPGAVRRAGCDGRGGRRRCPPPGTGRGQPGSATDLQPQPTGPARCPAVLRAASPAGNCRPSSARRT